MVEAAARANNLPLEFFARVIWQESRFQSDAVGPMTRSGQRAQGIAQFMPGTANERRLLDPFDPVQALPKSAEFLAELRSQFGNLGLAAAAYNAGPRRVQEWLAGTGSMPQETRHYVAVITGATVEEWQSRRPRRPDIRPGRRTYDLPGLDGTAQARAELFCQPARTARAARRGPAMGRATGAVASIATRDGDVFAGDGETAGRDRRPDADLAELRRIAAEACGAFYQVRIGADTRKAADDLCNRIRRAGGACFVLRNIRG